MRKRSQNKSLSDKQLTQLAVLDDMHVTMNNTAILLACCHAASEMLQEEYGLSEDQRLDFAQCMVDRAVKMFGEISDGAARGKYVEAKTPI